ncbi:MAG: hypothetical protein QM760_14645 [Nibricoccus sp.]
MEIDYEKWHDGVGYDLSLIAAATTQQRQRIEQIVLARQAQGLARHRGARRARHARRPQSAQSSPSLL